MTVLEFVTGRLNGLGIISRAQEAANDIRTVLADDNVIYNHEDELTPKIEADINEFIDFVEEPIIGMYLWAN